MNNSERLPDYDPISYRRHLEQSLPVASQRIVEEKVAVPVNVNEPDKGYRDFSHLAVYAGVTMTAVVAAALEKPPAVIAETLPNSSSTYDYKTQTIEYLSLNGLDPKLVLNQLKARSGMGGENLTPALEKDIEMQLKSLASSVANSDAFQTIPVEQFGVMIINNGQVVRAYLTTTPDNSRPADMQAWLNKRYKRIGNNPYDGKKDKWAPFKLDPLNPPELINTPTGFVLGQLAQPSGNPSLLGWEYIYEDNSIVLKPLEKEIVFPHQLSYAEKYKQMYTDNIPMPQLHKEWFGQMPDGELNLKFEKNLQAKIAELVKNNTASRLIENGMPMSLEPATHNVTGISEHLHDDYPIIAGEPVLQSIKDKDDIVRFVIIPVAYQNSNGQYEVKNIALSNIPIEIWNEPNRNIAVSADAKWKFRVYAIDLYLSKIFKVGEQIQLQWAKEFAGKDTIKPGSRGYYNSLTLSMPGIDGMAFVIGLTDFPQRMKPQFIN